MTEKPCSKPTYVAPPQEQAALARHAQWLAMDPDERRRLYWLCLNRSLWKPDEPVCWLHGLDLRGAYFRSARLPPGSDLSGTDLRGAHFEGAVLSGVNLRGARLARAVFDGTTMFGTDLAGATGLTVGQFFPPPYGRRRVQLQPSFLDYATISTLEPALQAAIVAHWLRQQAAGGG